MTRITVPEQGDRILYRHGRGDLPHGTPDVVPGVVYEILGWSAEGTRTEARPDEVVVLAHDCMGQPILARGDSHRLPRAVYSPDAAEPGSWCYAPADSHAGRDEIEVPDTDDAHRKVQGWPGWEKYALGTVVCSSEPTWTQDVVRELDAMEPAQADSRTGYDETKVPDYNVECAPVESPCPNCGVDLDAHAPPQLYEACLRGEPVQARAAALCPTWTDEDQRELDQLRRHVHLCSLGDRPQHPGVEKMRRLDELEQRAKTAYVQSFGQVRS